ncbi:MAG: hypothetical protein ACRD96_00215, partial [Bryobacteraceae bacterium]
GWQPRWSRDGRELFYVSGDGKLTVVPVKTGAQFEAGTPKPLFPIPLSGETFGRRTYDVSPDGQRVLALVPEGEARPAPIQVILNWRSLVEKDR